MGRWLDRAGGGGSMYQLLPTVGYSRNGLLDSDLRYITEWEDGDLVFLDESDECVGELLFGAVPPLADVVESEL